MQPSALKHPPAPWKAIALALPRSQTALAIHLCHAGTHRESVCVPSSHVFGLCWKARVCQTAAVCPSPQVWGETGQFLHLEAKLIKKDAFLLFFSLKRHLNTSRYGNQLGLICLHMGTKEGTDSRRYILFHPPCVMVLLPHSHGCQQQPCLSFRLAA